jgi:transposase
MHKSKSAKQWRMPDELWSFVEYLLPTPKNRHRYGGGRRRTKNRDAMDAIFHILRTGAQWNSLNASGICSSSTAHRRMQEWRGAGVFEKLWKMGLELYDDLKGLDWSWLSMDGAMTKAPLGGEKDWAQPHGSGQIRHQAQSVGRSGGRTGRLGRRRRQHQ